LTPARKIQNKQSNTSLLYYSHAQNRKMSSTVQQVILLLLLLVCCITYTYAQDDPNDFPEVRMLFGTGSNRFGQLGQFDTKLFTQAPMNFTVTKFCVVNQKLSTSETTDAEAEQIPITVEPDQYHAVAVSDTLDVYTWGFGGPGQGSLARLDTTVHTKEPQFLFNIKTLSAASTSVSILACGDTNTIIVTNDNKVVVFGSHAKGQLGVSSNLLLMYF
jgi:alpha-tubulin suppressor-like RCC1 family protein